MFELNTNVWHLYLYTRIVLYVSHVLLLQGNIKRYSSIYSYIASIWTFYTLRALTFFIQQTVLHVRIESFQTLASVIYTQKTFTVKSPSFFHVMEIYRWSYFSQQLKSGLHVTLPRKAHFDLTWFFSFIWNFLEYFCLINNTTL